METKIVKYGIEQEQEQAQLNQMRMILELYETPTWLLLENTLEQMKRNYRAKKDKLVSDACVEVKPKIIVLGAKQDAIDDVFDEIKKIVAQGKTIIAKNEMLKNIEKGDY